MKNPWMSMWLSAANKTAGASRGLWMAEVKKQQQAFASDMAKAWGFGPRSTRTAPAKRRSK